MLFTLPANTPPPPGPYATATGQLPASSLHKTDVSWTWRQEKGPPCRDLWTQNLCSCQPYQPPRRKRGVCPPGCLILEPIIHSYSGCWTVSLLSLKTEKDFLLA